MTILTLVRAQTVKFDLTDHCGADLKPDLMGG